MSREFLTTALAVSLLTSPAFGADIFGAQDDSSFLRDSYSSDWDMSDNGDPLDFEIGIRYFYSIGSSKLTVNGGDYSSEDKSSIVELHARIDDNSTDTYLKANVGYAALIEGTYETPEFLGAQDMGVGSIGYVGADFGYMPLGNNDIRFGGFVGYKYSADNPSMGRSSFITNSGGGDSKENMVETNALRLGAVARAELGDKVDINIEAAVIPYAHLSGTYGAFSVPDFVSGGTNFTQGSEGSLSGNLYGAEAEVLLGFHATDDITLRVGGRISYLTGDASMSYTAREIGNPINAQNYIAPVSGLEFLRYGALVELTGRF